MFISKLNEENGAVLLLTGLSLFVILSFFALVVDFGYIFVTKAELQNTADAVALTAISELRNGETIARQKAESFAASYKVAGAPIIVTDSDIVFGHYNLTTDQFQPNGSKTNAVQIQAQRTQTAPSGPLELFFARIFNKNTSNVRAISTAVLDPRVVGVHGKNRLLPYSVIDFVVDENGDGDFDIGSTINIHPRSDAPGNFGFLDLDGGSNDVVELRYYIEHGYDKDFTIPPGGSIEVNGSAGIDGNSLLNSFEQIIGEEVFLPVHNWVIGEGDNAIFSVISILAVRIETVKLTGNPESRYIRVKIINFASSVLVVDPTAPENNSVAKPRLVL